MNDTLIQSLVKFAEASKPGRTLDVVMLKDDKTPAIYLYRLLNEKYGDKWWDWDIATIEFAIKKEYNIDISDITSDKIQALKLLVNNQRPFLDWFYFNQVACALCGVKADFTCLKAPSPGMAVAAMRTMMEIRPEEQFSREVKKYVCLLCIHDGVYVPPPSVKDILQEEFEHLIKKETRDLWPKIWQKAAEIIKKDYTESDEPESVQARRVMIVEQASNVYGG